MAIQFTPFQNGDTDYVSHLNTDFDLIAKALNSLFGGMPSSTSAVNIINFYRALFGNGSPTAIDETNCVGSIVGTSVQITAGYCWMPLLGSVVNNPSNQSTSLGGQLNGTYYISLDVVGTPYFKSSAAGIDALYSVVMTGGVLSALTDLRKFAFGNFSPLSLIHGGTSPWGAVNFALVSNGPTIPPTWQAQGGGAGFITGSGATNQVAFFTTASNISSNAFFVYDGATVAIGAALDGGRKLKVVTSGSDIAIHTETTRASGTNYSLFALANAVALVNHAGFFQASGAATNYGVRINAVPASSANWALFSDSAAQSYFQGFIGIGNATPTFPIDILRPTTAVTRFVDPGLRLATSSLAAGNTTHYPSPYIFLASNIWTGSATTKVFAIQNQGVSGVDNAYGLEFASSDLANILYLRGLTGFVGLRTNTPVSLLEVSNGYITAGGTAGNVLVGRFSASFPSTLTNGYFKLSTNNTGAQDGGLTISYLASDVMTAGITLRETGRVGIGNTAPTYMLDIQTDGTAASAVVVRDLTNAVLTGFAGASATRGAFGTLSNHNLDIITNNTAKWTVFAAGDLSGNGHDITDLRHVLFGTTATTPTITAVSGWGAAAPTPALHAGCTDQCGKFTITANTGAGLNPTVKIVFTVAPPVGSYLIVQGFLIKAGPTTVVINCAIDVSDIIGQKVFTCVGLAAPAAGEVATFFYNVGMSKT